MKVQLRSGDVIGHGIATDGAPTMDPDFARLMFGVTCHEVHADGSLGRSVDPRWAVAGDDWLVGLRLLSEQRAADEFASWIDAFAPCEALRSRDPGQKEKTS